MALPGEQARLQAERDATLAQALGDPARIGVLRALAGASAPMNLEQLAATSGLESATIATHLPILIALGVLASAEATDATQRAFRFAETELARAVESMFRAKAPTPSSGRVTRPQASGTLDAILDQMASGVAIYDAGGRLVRLNPAGERITRRSVAPGESQEDRLARYGMRQSDGAPMPVEDSPSGRALRGEVVAQMECVIAGQHGQDTWLRCSAAPLRDEQGAIAGAVVVFEDITEQRRLSRDESRQRALAGAMIQHAFSGMAVFDASDAFRCIQCNDTFQWLLEPALQASGAILGAPLDDLFAGEIGAQIRAIFERARATGQPYINNEFSAVLPPDTQRRWYRFRLTPLRDNGGNISELLVVAVEITVLVAAREASRRHAQELSAIIDAMPEAVLLADSSGAIVLSNAAAERILGHHLAADARVSDYGETSHSYAPNGHPLAASELPVMRALQGETVVGQEMTYQRDDGERIDLLTSAAPVDFDDSGEIAGAVAVFQDITRIKALERQRDDFLGIAAHELRTPLATILATLQAFLRRLQSQPGGGALDADALVSGLDRMNRQAKRLDKLVSDLLDATRIRTGTLDYDLEPCDLTPVVREAVAGQRAANPERRVTLSVPAHPVLVVGDAFRLSQVVDNLVANALKYSLDDKPVAVSLKIEEGSACLRVADKGVGIPPANVAHLFDRFYRVPAIEVQSGAGIGLGLGLHITRSIVERHGGGIEVRSTPGKGSMFIVSLPLLDDAQHQNASASFLT